MTNVCNFTETTRNRLQDELDSLKSSTSTSSSEVEGLHAQVTRLETSNRETLSLLDSKSTAHDKLAGDLASQHQKTSELRREISSHQERLRNADNDSSSAKFRESSIQQEVELLKRNNDWLNSELQTKSGDYSKYRKDKSAKISELQRTNEDAQTSLASSRRAETTLRQRLDELSQKLDDSFAKIQQITEEAARSGDSFRAELDSSRRLSELQRQSAETSKRRVQELDEIVDQMKADAADEIAQVQAEMETERTAKEAAEQRVEELEMQVERLEANIAAVPAPSRPQTPVIGRNSRSAFATSARAGSPSMLPPGTPQARGGVNFTQLYSDYNNAKAALDEEKRRSAKFSATIEEMIDDLDKRAPEFQELKMENARMDADASNISKVLDNMQKEKDAVRKEARRWEGEVAGLRRQEQLLRHQLRDRDAQVKFLAVSVNLYEEGVRVNELQREQLQQMAIADFSDQAYDGLSDTDRFISQRLVTFRGVSELQETNAKLLNLTRQLGEQMEVEEAKTKQDQQQQDQAELASLREQKDQLKDQVQSLITQSNSFIQERDMFRRMLENRKQLPRDADLQSMFGESVNGPVTPRTPRGGTASVNGEHSPASREHTDQMKLVKEMQIHFDAYKQEAATDHSTLRGQIDKLAKEKGELQGDIARVKSQLTLAHERFEMLQSNFNLARTENEELQKRSRSLEDAAAREDMRLQQTSEDLIQARELSDGLRGENANLKAEKDLWKRIEGRLSEDNRSLTEERGRLNKIISDAQSLSNQRELSDSETRRHLQNQVESLETELRTSQRKLDQEIEDSKRASLRREYESEQSRTRIDELLQGLNNSKEEMIAIKTTRDQHQARVEELKIELRYAQEHAQALQPRPTPRPTNAGPSTTGDQDGSLSREQELGIEVADVRRDLDIAKSDLENANAQVEQYKGFSHSSEEALNYLQETHGQYIEDMDKAAAEKSSKITELEQRVEDISSELSISKTQLSELRASASEYTSRLDAQKSIHEAEVSRLKDESERYQDAAKIQQQYVKAQAEIALSAQQSYDSELQKHAEAAKALQQVRSEFNAVKLEVSSSSANAEAAQATIMRNEESWISTREQYERELLDLKQRKADVETQNTLLHKQLESVSLQITSLQQKQASGSNAAETESSTDTSLQNLQEVIKYLRREKEIVDVQYELSVQESRRLKQQLDYSQSQMDEARLKLDQERQRQADKERNSTSHSQMVDTLNQINVYRESNASLREDARRVRVQLEEKAKRVDELTSQLQPLQSSLQELENNLETTQGDHELLKQDRDHWQKRTQDILQKYDRVDPAELEALKNKLEASQRDHEESASSKQLLQQELETARSETQSLKAGIETQISAARLETRKKIEDQFKDRARKLSAEVKQAKLESQTANTELDGVKTELEEVRKARDEAIAKADAMLAEAVLPVEAQPHKPAQQDGDVDMEEGEEGEVGEAAPHDNTSTPTINASPAANREEVAEAQRLQVQVNDLEGQVRTLEGRVTELEGEVQTGQAQLAILRQKQQSIQSQQALPDAPSNSEHIEKLQSDLQAAQAELEASRQATQAPSNETSAQTDAARADLEKAYKEKMEACDESFDTRVTQMKEQLNQKLREGRQKAKEDISKDHEEALQKLRDEHNTQLTNLTSSHQTELDELKVTLADAQKQLQEPKTASTNGQEASSESKVPESTSDADTSSGPTGSWTESKDQVRKFVSTNPICKDIVLLNIRKKVQQEQETSAKTVADLKEGHSTQITELEHANTAKLEDAQQKAVKKLEQAVGLESMKWKVKINMAESKARIAVAKIDIFEKAATDTPEKPVIEVWLIAKDFKPAPLQPTAIAPIQTQAASVRSSSQGQDPPLTPAKVQSPQTDIPPQQAPQSATTIVAPTASALSPTKPFSQEHPETKVEEHPQEPQSPVPEEHFSSQQSERPSSQTNGTTPGSVGLPQKPPPSQAGAYQQGAGTGAAALRGLSQGSGLPRVASGGTSIRGAANRGAGTGGVRPDSRPMLPDGPLGGSQPQRGGPSNYGQSGIGRGGPATRHGGRPGMQIQGASTRNSMDPNASQFVPNDSGQGQKRARRDSSGSEQWTNGGKRPRGGQRGGRGH